mmetsp:Transcript_43231/g.68394  ORF Transcript_43231/g.68394 Transcript_43231/m.68394 type:complete len:80 (+) Transcript_43231:2253-2492(+)
MIPEVVAKQLKGCGSMRSGCSRSIVTIGWKLEKSSQVFSGQRRQVSLHIDEQMELSFKVLDASDAYDSGVEFERILSIR